MFARTAAPILVILISLPGAVFSQVEMEVKATDLKVSAKPAEKDAERIYSPFVGRDYPDQVLFGDSHFHTELSFDAGLVGTSLDAHDGFKVARGEKVISNTGQPVQLIRPLDFLVITDHAEMLGMATAIRESSPILLEDPWGKWAYERFNSGQEGRMEVFADIIRKSTVEGINPFSSDALAKSIWNDFIKVAELYNEPGRFTAMTGFEWTYTPKGDNLHRVVIFADGADKTSKTVPFSFFDGSSPEQLWDYLAGYEQDTGGRAIAVPHNGNTSNGLMFTDKMSNGEAMTSEHAKKRIRWEPLHEMSQIKGDEETHPLLSPDDEFADFETWAVGNLGGTAAKEDWMLQYEYARSALKLGLKLGKELGVNPFKFGMNATTDTHTALPTSREENYFGKYQHTEPSPERFNHEVIPADDPALRIMTSQESAAGLTAVWARENTREAIFDSLTRKEVYATTGTRIRVRVFGGWDFAPEDVSAVDFAAKGYSHGVPMGGDLNSMRPTVLRRASSSVPCVIRTEPISIGCRSSRDGSMMPARLTSESTMWQYQADEKLAPTVVPGNRSGLPLILIKLPSATRLAHRY